MHARIAMPLARSLAAFAFSALLLTACGTRDEATPAAAGTDTTELTHADPDPGRDFVDPNQATAATLTQLPGFTDSVALAVIAGRPYASMLSLERVLARHISAERRDSLYTRLWLPFDLNTASSDEILLIPGVDSRVRYELEEYRPYEDDADFRRRIGEQLGPEEAARLNRYVTLR